MREGLGVRLKVEDVRLFVTKKGKSVSADSNGWKEGAKSEVEDARKKGRWCELRKGWRKGKEGRKKKRKNGRGEGGGGGRGEGREGRKEREGRGKGREGTMEGTIEESMERRKKYLSLSDPLSSL